MLRIGFHVSSTGGFLTMGKTTREAGANVFQFFTRNPRGGAARPWPQADIDAYAAFAAQHKIGAPLGHAPYTLNPAAEKPQLRAFARDTMADDLKKLEAVPEAMYNFHPGSHVGQGIERGIELCAECLNAAVDPSGTVPVLLETMAGKGSELGGRFEHLREIIDRAKTPERVGVCLDTCHVFDAGYNIKDDLDGVLTEFDRVIGLPRLYAVHLNDTKNPSGSKKDRHEVLGGGELGEAAFRAVINHPALKNLPFYLETPNELPGYAAEIALLKEWRD